LHRAITPMSRGRDVSVVDELTGRVWRVSVPPPVCIAVAAFLLSLPVLIGLGAKLRAGAELDRLRAVHAKLEAENANYRAAADTFTGQVRSLAGVVDDLPAAERVHAPVSPPRPPAPPASALVSAALLPSFSTPEDLYGVLRGVLVVLADRLPGIEQDVRRREALAEAAPLTWPTEGLLTAGFGQRSDPLTGQRGFHEGLDISTAFGRPVFATGSGIIEIASYSGDFGNLVVIEHGFGLATRYGHLSRFALGVGSIVRRGDVVGYVGATGRATGAHVHYEILANGAPIDPLKVLITSRPAN